MAPGSPLGPARETVFVIGSNPYGQRSILDIGKGIWILDGGFGVVPGVQIYYGFANATTPAPLGLNLSAYSAFQLTFAGISTEDVLGVDITVWTHSGGVYAANTFLRPDVNVLSVDFQFSSFQPGPLDASDIDYIGIVTWGGGTNSYGITSFQAVPSPIEGVNVGRPPSRLRARLPAPRSLPPPDHGSVNNGRHRTPAERTPVKG